MHGVRARAGRRRPGRRGAARRAARRTTSSSRPTRGCTWPATLGLHGRSHRRRSRLRRSRPGRGGRRGGRGRSNGIRPRRTRPISSSRSTPRVRAGAQRVVVVGGGGGRARPLPRQRAAARRARVRAASQHRGATSATRVHRGRPRRPDVRDRRGAGRASSRCCRSAGPRAGIVTTGSSTRSRDEDLAPGHDARCQQRACTAHAATVALEPGTLLVVQPDPEEESVVIVDIEVVPQPLGTDATSTRTSRPRSRSRRSRACTTR